MRWTGQIFWLLALFRRPPESPSSRLHPRKFRGLAQLGKSYPVTAAQLLPIYTGFLAPTHFFKARKELDREVAACVRRRKIYFEFIFSTGLQHNIDSTNGSLAFSNSAALRRRIALLNQRNVFSSADSYPKSSTIASPPALRLLAARRIDSPSG
jgi:hypothetical protein